MEGPAATAGEGKVACVCGMAPGWLRKSPVSRVGTWRTHFKPGGLIVAVLLGLSAAVLVLAAFFGLCVLVACEPDPEHRNRWKP